MSSTVRTTITAGAALILFGVGGCGSGTQQAATVTVTAQAATVTATAQSSPAGAIGADGASPSTSTATNCAAVATTGQADLDGKAAWLAANQARDDANTAYFNGADYVGVTDAQAKADALYQVWMNASTAYTLVRRTPGCEALATAHDQVDLARDLVQHKSAGADEKLAAALSEWQRLAG